MEHVTTIVDVIEDELGNELNAREAARLARLSDQDLTKLSHALQEHAAAPYTKPPLLGHKEVCCLAHQDGALTAALGGAPRRFGHVLEASDKHLVGMLLLSLMYLPRVAIADGLTYHLGNWYWGPPNERGKELYRPMVLRLLRFYGEVRSLIKSGHMVLLPLSLWNDVHISLNTVPMGATTARDHQLQAFQNAVMQEDFFGARRALEAVDAYYAEHVLYEAMQATRELLVFCAATGYSPVLESVPDQAAFTFLTSESPSAGRPQTTRIIQQHSVLAPYFGALPVDDFLQAHEGEAFAEFRRTIEDLATAAQSTVSPMELQDLLTSKLEPVKAAIDREVSRSAVLGGAKQATKEVIIGAIVGSGITALVAPTLLDDPWKITVGALAGAGAKLVEAFMTARSSAVNEKKAVSRLYAALITESDR